MEDKDIVRFSQILDAKNEKFYPPELATNDSQLESCRSLINPVFKAEQFVSHQYIDMIPIEKCKSALSGTNKKMFMVREKNSDRIIGTLLLTINVTCGTSLIQYFARDPEYKKTRVADSLMEVAEDYAKKMNQKKIQLSVAWHPLDQKINGLIDFYTQKWGYKHIPNQDQHASNEIKKTLAPQYANDTLFKYYEKILTPFE